MTAISKRASRVSALALLMVTGCGQGVTSTGTDPGASVAEPARAGTQQLYGQRPPEVARLSALGAVPDETPIDVAIGLGLPNEDERDAFVRDLYDPASPVFHQFLTPEEFTARFAPSPESYQAVLDFVARSGLTVIAAAPNRHHVHVRGSAAAVRSAFHVSLNQYQHPTEDRTFYAPDREPSVDLNVPLKYVSGLDDLHPPRRSANPETVINDAPHAGGSGSGGAFTGNDFRKAYAPGVGLTGAGQAIGVLQLNGYNASDITAYEQKNGYPNVPIQNVYLAGYTGTGGNQAPNAESPADIELVISMAPGASKVNVYGVPYTNPAILDALTEMANPTKGEPLPNQITTSYYFNYQSGAVYAPLAQLAAQGQALSVASGDYGSYNETSGGGDFPPTDDPHVTAVGGTVLTTNSSGAWSSETTWASSGGGFSPWSADPEFKIPAWQAGMNFAAFGGSSAVRNAPDVAMPATGISLFYNGGWNGFAGTSAASPLWAGFMALANQQAALRARPRIGFPNPALYAIGRGGSCPTCFHDITTGNNFNATNPSKYSAVAGYDLCTGWGTPNGQTLIDALVNSTVGWGVLPGGGTTVLADAATTFQNKLYVFGIGINDHQHYMNVFNGNAWAGWSAVPGGGTTELSDAATVFQNKLYIFGIGIGDHQHYMNSFNGSTWSGWSAVPGGGTTELSDAATVFQNKLYIFGIGIGDHQHYVNSFNGSTWSGWSVMPGGGTTNVADAAVALGNELYVFGIGINDHHHYVNAFNGTTWRGWSAVPGGGTTLLSDAAAVFENKVYLFGIGINDHQHYMNIYP
ncbi:MAG TPA: protease pro-enzyme activation domain-containing protein [Polyangiaceae bacterium]